MAMRSTIGPDLAGQLVVITGVSAPGQLGEALAEGFASRGASLALVARRAAEVAARGAELRDAGVLRAGARVSTHAADLANPEATRRLAAEVLAAHARDAVDAVICAAGGFGMTGPLDAADPDAWARQLHINLDTAFATTRAFLPALRAGRGSLVYIGSIAATPGGNPGGMAAYAAAKSGVLALMRAVAAEEGAHGVRANAVAPAAIRTASNVAAMGQDARYVERESVADVVAFLASPMARNVTGQVITLTGTTETS